MSEEEPQTEPTEPPEAPAEVPPEGEAPAEGEAEGGEGTEQPKEGEEPKKPEKEETVTFKNLKEIGLIVNYLGDFSYLELAEPIEDSQKKVLVQKGTVLRESIFTNLQSRKPNELPSAFTFRYSKRYKDRLKIKLRTRLYECLNPTRYHIAPQIQEYTERDYTKLGDSILEMREMLDYFVALDMEDEPLLPHLGEVAIVNTGLVDMFLRNFTDSDGKNNALRLAFTTGLLHDIALVDDYNFLANDLELAKESGHEQKGADMVKDKFPALNKSVAEIIASHHREEPAWEDPEATPLNMRTILAECLTFTEYFFGQLRMAYKLQLKTKTPEESLNKVFFNMGQAFGQSWFHPILLQIVAQIQDRFRNILRYGNQIGSLESKCLFKNSAVAYPSPRCSQILCRNKEYDCELINTSLPINIITPTKTMGWVGKDIQPGKYPKCRLSEKLPPIPPELGGVKKTKPDDEEGFA